MQRNNMIKNEVQMGLSAIVSFLKVSFLSPENINLTASLMTASQLAHLGDSHENSTEEASI